MKETSNQCFFNIVGFEVNEESSTNSTGVILDNKLQN